MRAVGIILVCAACAAMGIFAGERLKHRAAVLSELFTFVSALKSEICYSGNELRPAILSAASDLEEMSGFHEAFCQFDSGEFEVGWKNAISALPDCIKREDAALLFDLGSSLGISGVREQGELCERIALSTSAAFKTASEEATRLSGLYGSFGVLGGIAAAILLI